MEYPLFLATRRDSCLNVLSMFRSVLLLLEEDAIFHSMVAALSKSALSKSAVSTSLE